MPGRDNTTSVFRTALLQEEEIWALADLHIPSEEPAQARADLHIGTVREVGLDVHPDDVPPRHAVIVGWPPLKPDQKVIALKIANGSELVVRKLPA